MASHWPSILVVLLPCILFAAALVQVYHQVRITTKFNYYEYGWLAVYELVHLISTAWLANALYSLDGNGMAPLVMQTTTARVGPGILIALLLILYSRALLSMPFRLLTPGRRREPSAPNKQ